MCLATRREVFDAAGFGDDTAFSEDKVFQQNAWQAGFRKFVYTQEAAGFHGHQYTLGSLWKRCRNEGFGWREVGVSYRAGQLALDLLSPSIYAKLGLGLMSGRVRSLPELLFPWVRPLAVFQGNRWSREWQR
jgi:rhamnosyltransferase